MAAALHYFAKTASPLALVACLCVPNLAAASPWTLPKGRVSTTTTGSYHVATQEYLDFGRQAARPYPLDGRFSSGSLTLGVRFGFTDDLEFEAQLPLKLVAYRAAQLPLPYEDAQELADEIEMLRDDDVLDDDQLEDADRLGELTDKRKFDSSAAGPSDFILAVRRRITSGSLPTALELKLKVPMGYDPPQGTDEGDDVTLGDGQMDIGLNYLVGLSLPTRTFLRFDIGYNARIKAGHEVISAFKAGQFLNSSFMVYVETAGTLHVTDGPSIGTTLVSIDPDLPTRDFTVDNVRPVTRHLHQSSLKVGGGTIWRVAEGIEYGFGYSYVIWGRNTAALHAFYFGVTVATDVGS